MSLITNSFGVDKLSDKSFSESLFAETLPFNKFFVRKFVMPKLFSFLLYKQLFVIRPLLYSIVFLCRLRGYNVFKNSSFALFFR